MAKQIKNRRRSIVSINVVPYIDVMLVLLVIFMITAPLLNQGVSVNLPQAKAEAIKDQEEPLIVSVDQTGNYFLNAADDPDAPLSAQQLTTRLSAEIAVDKKNNISRSVLVKGDKNVQYGKVVVAMTLLQQAGIQKIGLMTQTPADR